MPTLYNQGGLWIVVYHRDHEPVHCHVLYKGIKAKIEWIDDSWQVRYHPHQTRTFRTKSLRKILATIKKLEKEIFRAWQK